MVLNCKSTKSICEMKEEKHSAQLICRDICACEKQKEIKIKHTDMVWTAIKIL